ncbi:MAG: hypothetical protein AAF847_07470 [Bacteroidota bacterium]
MVAVAMEVFDEYMPNNHQIERKRTDVEVSAADLIAPPKGTITEVGLRLNINVGILYIESWLRGAGAAAIYHLMEDAATAEISRTQVWQWIHNETYLEDGRPITYELYRAFLAGELSKIEAYVGKERYANGKFEAAIDLFDQLVKHETFIDFLTLPAYEMIE